MVKKKSVIVVGHNVNRLALVKNQTSHSKWQEKNALRFRLMSLMTIALSLFVLLVIRLAHLQLVEGEEYRQLADENRYFREVIPAPRGVFLDRYRRPLVQNTKSYFVKKSDQLFASTQPISHQTALAMMAANSKLVTDQLRRQYLYPWELAHLLGYVAPVSTADLLQNPQLKVGDWVGRMGLEESYDQVLRGRDGYRMFEINTFGEKQRLIDEKQPLAGNDILTSIDPYLTKIAYEALGQAKGAVLMVDATTGQLLAMVSKPTFNANDLVNRALDEAAEKQRRLAVEGYFADERKVFFNRAVSGVYPPGSVFKLVTSIAGLENGSFDETRSVVDEGILKVGDYEYANWLYTQQGATDGEISLVRALARSNDIFFYKAAEWVGPDRLAAQARQFGLGEPTGVELAGEASGLVPDPTWKEKTQGERWFLGNTYHFGIGQGDLTVTPIQVAQLVQTLNNNGVLCHPKVVLNDGKDEWTAENCTNLGLSLSSIELTLEGMVAACQQGGTGSLLFKFNQGLPLVTDSKNAQELIENGAVGCKTGTSEFGVANALGRRNTHGWFVTITSVELKKVEDNLQSLLEQKKEQQIKGEVEDNSILSEADIEMWLEGVKQNGFPQKIAVVVLVESDEAFPFREGLRDSAPIVVQLLDYLK